MNKKLNENTIAITGKASVIDELILGNDYDIKITANCVSKQQKDRQDSTYDLHHSLKLITGEILNDRGENIKLKRKGSNSQRLYYCITNLGLDYDEEIQKILKYYLNKYE